MAESNRLPPTFHPPKILKSPEVLESLNNEAYVQDGILYRAFKSISPL